MERDPTLTELHRQSRASEGDWRKRERLLYTE